MLGWIYLAPVLPLCWLFRRLIANCYLYFFFVLGATAAHELCHFSVGVLLGAKPTGFSIIPHKIGKNKWALGSVSFGNIRWYNGVFIGMAPLLILAPFYLLIPSHFVLDDFKDVGYKECITWLAMAYLMPSAMPSSQDLKVATASLFPVVAFSTLAYLFYRY